MPAKLDTPPQAEARPALRSLSLHDSPAWQATLQSLLTTAGHVLVPGGFLVTWLPYSPDPTYKEWLRIQGTPQGLQLQHVLAEQRRSGLARGVAVFRRGLAARVCDSPAPSPDPSAAAVSQPDGAWRKHDAFKCQPRVHMSAQQGHLAQQTAALSSMQAVEAENVALYRTQTAEAGEPEHPAPAESGLVADALAAQQGLLVNALTTRQEDLSSLQATAVGHLPATGLGHLPAAGLGHLPAAGLEHLPAAGLGHLPATLKPKVSAAARLPADREACQNGSNCHRQLRSSAIDACRYRCIPGLGCRI